MSDAAPIITLDGPGGAGKGTLAGQLSGWLGWSLLDSGALYRLVGLVALQENLDVEDAGDVDHATRRAAELDVRFRTGDAGQEVWLGGRDVSQEIRDDAVSQAASRWAALPPIRQALLERQRAFARPPGLIADGRDMGTVIFPGADLKFFVTASAEERARRRHAQLSQQGVAASLSKIYREIVDRDARDASRKASPLKPAEDAYVIDTTGDSVSSSARRIRERVVAKGWLSD